MSSINATLTCTAQLDVEHCRSLPRVVSYSVRFGKLLASASGQRIHRTTLFQSRDAMVFQPGREVAQS